MKKKYKCLNLDDYIFPGYEEITGDELYRINGGGRIQPEQNENPPEGDSSKNHNIKGQVQLDALNIDASAGRNQIGLSLNAASVSGTIGGSFFGIDFSIGGSAGLVTGFELKYDKSAGSAVFDLGFIFKPRIELNWSKK